MFFGKRFSGYHSGTISGLDILVLSFIKNNDGISGYEIIQKVNKKFKDLWKASAGTIYPLLNRLTEKGFVHIKEITENNRQKKIYRITDRGKEALKSILEDNLEPSISTLGSFISTIIKASMPNEKTMEKMMGCFPFPGFPFDEDFDRTDYSQTNIKQLKGIISHLESGKHKLKVRIDMLESKIKDYKKILEKIEEERERNKKPIEVSDNEKDFYI